MVGCPPLDGPAVEPADGPPTRPTTRPPLREPDFSPVVEVNVELKLERDLAPVLLFDCESVNNWPSPFLAVCAVGATLRGGVVKVGERVGDGSVLLRCLFFGGGLLSSRCIGLLGSLLSCCVGYGLLGTGRFIPHCFCVSG